MLSNLIEVLLLKELEQFASEIRAFNSDEALWKEVNGVSNSAGNLALHIIGNINHYVGAIIGNSGYVRNRDLEFSDKYVSRELILDKIEETKYMLSKVFSGITDDDLSKEYPVKEPFGNVSTGNVLLIILSHLSYHLGQVNYYRRITEAG